MKTGKDITKILKENEYLWGQDGSWRSYYQDLANFCLPRKAWITSHRVLGERIKDAFLYDVRAIRCAKESTSGFHSHLTNPSSRWFQTVLKDERLMQSGANQRYLKHRDDIQFDVMNASNFDRGILENYMDHLVFGTGNLMIQEDEVDEVRYLEIPVEQYSFAEDSRGRACRVFRNFQWTAIKLYEEFGDDCPREVIEALDDNPYTLFDVLHYVAPRGKRNVYKEDYLNMEWESQWILKKPETQLRESGFKRNPFSIGRFWCDANDPRGFSPAMDALASIKLLNAEKRTFIRHAMKASDPAWMAPYKSFLNTPNFNPSAANYYDSKKFKADAFRFLAPEGNAQVNIEAMELETMEIERAFFVDVFRSISMVTQDKKKRSIPEVQRVIAEGMSMLGPIIGKMIDETIDPILEKTGEILDERGIFEPAPGILQGKETKIEYLSPLARAQKQSEMIGMSAWLQVVAEIANFKPEILDPINVDKISKIIADIQGVDPDVYYSEEYVNKLRQQRAKMQMAQQQIAMAEQGAGAAHKGAQAQKASKEAAVVGAE